MIYLEIIIGLFFLVLNVIIYKKNKVNLESMPKIEYTDKGILIRNREGKIVINGDKVI